MKVRQLIKDLSDYDLDEEVRVYVIRHKETSSVESVSSNNGFPVIVVGDENG